jgi:hypothetical protein
MASTNIQILPQSPILMLVGVRTISQIQHKSGIRFSSKSYTLERGTITIFNPIEEYNTQILPQSPILTI